MKHIIILVPEKAVLGSVEGPRQLFAQVNQFCIAAGKDPLFKIQLVAQKKEIPVSGGLITVHADALLKDAPTPDLVIIPAFDDDIPSAIAKNSGFVPWIKEQHSKGAEVASLCMGAFILASTGLLDGKRCATHWVAANEFIRMFPQVNLIAERIITDENGLYSSGGAFSYLNLILYLIEKYAGREMAILCAKVFAIEIERKSQSPFIMFRGQTEHNDDPVKKAQEFIEVNFQEKITVDQLADISGLSRRSFERRFKKATNNTVAEYIQRVKVEAVKKDLETSNKNINEAMYDVGYSDTKAFRSTFKRITGLSPVQYKNKYNMGMAVN
ncbi:MAG TPA: helix-turn-helix domain-containing protein [Bacteroidia bacterium]|nr:helix-turn-helix domain-containing protein [Bacteroidia bacterium]